MSITSGAENNGGLFGCCKHFSRKCKKTWAKKVRIRRVELRSFAISSGEVEGKYPAAGLDARKSVQVLFLAVYNTSHQMQLLSGASLLLHSSIHLLT
jgi:hypothetical protein